MLNFQISLPTVSEQIEICSFLNTQQEILYNLTDKSQKGIVLLQERRTALISATVTGKIDVRNWMQPEQNKTNKENTL